MSLNDPYKDLDREIDIAESDSLQGLSFRKIYWIFGVIVPVATFALVWLVGAF